MKKQKAVLFRNLNEIGESREEDKKYFNKGFEHPSL